MTRVKVFSSYHENKLDILMNKWLAEHPDINIRDIKLSSSLASVNEDGIPLFTAMVIFTPRTAPIWENLWGDTFMNLKEFERSLSDFSTGYETYIKLMSDIKRLDNLIQANEKQLNDSLIKIPFTRLYFVDGLGIFKHQTPTLLKQNRQLIIKYNRKLIKAKKLSSSLQKQLKTIRSDYLRSNGEESEEKDKLANKYLKQFGQIRHP